jgi:hypothetical protein
MSAAIWNGSSAVPWDMLIARYITPILVVTGAITALPVLQFFFPTFMLKQLSGVTVEEEAGRLFARHWGLVTLTIGALLIYAGIHAEARAPIMAAVTVEKLGLVWLVLRGWNRFPKMRLTGIFDAACSAIYLAYLAGG